MLLLIQVTAVISCLKMNLNLLPGGKTTLVECDRSVHTYVDSTTPRFKGKLYVKMLKVTVPHTNMSAIAEFYIVPSHTATLVGRKTSEMLAILKIGINVNNCSIILENAQPVDKKASRIARFPKVFKSLGKLKGYQLKLHQNVSISPVAQPLPSNSIQQETESDRKAEAVRGAGYH